MFLHFAKCLPFLVVRILPFVTSPTFRTSPHNRSHLRRARSQLLLPSKPVTPSAYVMPPSYKTHLDHNVVRIIESKLPREISGRIFGEVARPMVQLTRDLVRNIQSRVPIEISDQIFAHLFEFSSPWNCLYEWRGSRTWHPFDILEGFTEPFVVGERLAEWCKNAFFKANIIIGYRGRVQTDEILANTKHLAYSILCYTYSLGNGPIWSHEEYETILQLGVCN